MKKNITNRGPGRPAYSPKFPAKLKWTMTDFCIRNGVDPETGKGENCSKLTLVKYMAKDLSNRRSGLISKLKGEFAHPASDSGLGRKAFLYVLRARLSEVTAKPAAKRNSLPRASKATTSVAISTTEAYEAQKAALLAPTPEPTPVAPVTVPVVEIAPVATAPVAEVTAPVVA